MHSTLKERKLEFLRQNDDDIASNISGTRWHTQLHN